MLDVLSLVAPTNGKLMLSRLVQPLNAEEPMLVTLFGIVILVRFIQSRKALAPMLVTLSGIVMLIKVLQLNA